MVSFREIVASSGTQHRTWPHTVSQYLSESGTEGQKRTWCLRPT